MYQIIAIILGLLAFSSTVRAQAVSDKTVYVIDMQRVLEESILGKAAKQRLEAEFKESGVKLQKSKAALNSFRADIEKQAGLLSSEALEEKRESLLKKEKELARAYQDQQEGLVKKNDIEIGSVVKQIDKAVQELAAKEKFDFIIENDKRFVVYVEKDYDITDRVVKLLDSKS